jgi:arylsulfatase A-like enzyme
VTARPTILAALVIGWLATAVLGAAEPLRPNILWIVSEDNGPYLGCYGEPLARTPVLDRLAREGVRYTRARAAAPVCAPSRCSLITGRYASALGTQNMRSRWEVPAGVRYFPELLRAAGWYCSNNAKTDYNIGNDRIAEAWDESGKQAHWRRRPAGRPFFSVFNLETTHESCLHRRLPLTTDPAAVRVPAYLPDLPEVRQDIAQYHDRMAAMDAQVGELLAELERDGLAGSTIVVYYSDHAGALPRGKRFLYDSGTRVPLIVRVPPALRALAAQDPGTACDELAGLIDLGPTVLSWCGIQPPPEFHGRALAGPFRAPPPPWLFTFRERMDERYDSSRAVTDGRLLYIRNYQPQVANGQHLDYQWQAASMRAWAAAFAAGTLTPVQAAFFRAKPVEELYDLAADPDNVVDLAADPAHAGALAGLRAALHASLIAVRDTGFLPEPLLATLRAGQPSLAYAADEQRYPLGRLVELVDRMQVGRDAAAVAAGLGDPHPVVRHWAASASYVLGEEPAGLAALLADANPAIRVAAAEAILRRRPEPAAVAVINATLGGAEPWPVRLAAANAVARLADRAPFAAGLRAADLKDEYLGRLVPWLLAQP